RGPGVDRPRRARADGAGDAGRQARAGGPRDPQGHRPRPQARQRRPRLTPAARGPRRGRRPAAQAHPAAPPTSPTPPLANSALVAESALVADSALVAESALVGDSALVGGRSRHGERRLAESSATHPVLVLGTPVAVRCRTMGGPAHPRPGGPTR